MLLMKKIYLKTLIALFVILKATLIFTGVGVNDESLYNVMAKLTSEGLSPYRDFFFAHPPVPLYFQALVFRIFGFGMVQARILPFVNSLLAVFIFLKFFENEDEKIKALSLVFTSMFFVSTSQFMFYSFMALFAVLGIGFYLKKAYFKSGFFFRLIFFLKSFCCNSTGSTFNPKFKKQKTFF